jgi:hypothetical protein
MLVPFTLSKNALRLADYDDVKKLDVVNSLARSLVKVGLLISYESSSGNCALADQAKHLPQDMRKQWSALLLAAEKKSRLVRVNLSFQEKFSEFLAILRDHVDLVYVGKEDAVLCGIPTGKTSVFEKNCEVCRVDCNASSISMQKALQASSGTIQKGANVSEVWKKLLEPLARLHSKLIVVDRYSVQNQVGLSRLFRELNSFREDKYLVVYSASDQPEQSKKAIRDVLNNLKPGSLREVELFLVPHLVFGREAHHRYIHFANDCCFQCDTGLAILEQQTVSKPTPYQFLASEPALVGCESKLRQNPGTRKEIFSRGNGLPRQASTATLSPSVAAS